MRSGKGAQVVLFGAGGVKGKVVAALEEFWPRAAEVQRGHDDVELDPAVQTCLKQMPAQSSASGAGFLAGLLQFGEQASAVRIVNRPPVVRIDEAKVPEFCSLIEVGDAGRGDLNQNLREGIA